jgi:7-carboxy-7-deazaguanine synthase
MFGCSVGCRWCDQPQCRADRKKISIPAAVMKIARASKGCRTLCITGGEPMEQWDDAYCLALEFLQRGWAVSVETSGCFKIEDDGYRRSFRYVMDVKCPSSGVSGRNVLENLSALKPCDEVKFVIGDRADFDFALRVLKERPTLAQVFFSPVYKRGAYQKNLGKLSAWVLEGRMFDVRVMVQLHKLGGFA